MQEPTKAHKKWKEIATVMMWSTVALVIIVAAGVYGDIAWR
jgi:hypothetical protein